METVIEVGYKQGAFDASAHGIKRDILDLGIKGARHVSTCRLYSIKGSPAEGNLQFIAEHILCDPVVQYYKIMPQFQERPIPGAECFVVEVWFKSGVTDNAGDSVKKAIEDLRISGVAGVRSGRKIKIGGRLARSRIVDITTRLLANGIVEDYKIYG